MTTECKNKIDKWSSNKNFQRLIEGLKDDGLTFKFESDEKYPTLIGYVYDRKTRKYAICEDYLIIKTNFLEIF